MSNKSQATNKGNLVNIIGQFCPLTWSVSAKQTWLLAWFTETTVKTVSVDPPISAILFVHSQFTSRGELTEAVEILPVLKLIISAVATLFIFQVN